jgi:hypothetical protein
MFRVVPPPIIRSANNYLQHLVLVTPLLLPAAIAAGSSRSLFRSRFCTHFSFVLRVLHVRHSFLMCLQVMGEKWLQVMKVFFIIIILLCSPLTLYLLFPNVSLYIVFRIPNVIFERGVGLYNTVNWNDT